MTQHKKCFTLELYKLFLQQDDVRENSDNLSEILSGIKDILEIALTTKVDEELKKGIADILDLKEFSKDTVINVDYPGDVVMDDFIKVDKLK